MRDGPVGQSTPTCCVTLSSSSEHPEGHLCESTPFGKTCKFEEAARSSAHRRGDFSKRDLFNHSLDDKLGHSGEHMRSGLRQT